MNPPEITPESLIETNLYFKSLKYVSNYQKTHPEKKRKIKINTIKQKQVILRSMKH